MANGNGLMIPRWAIVTGGLLIAIVSATWGAATKVTRHDEQMRVMDIRLCRIEGALAIPPWPTCPHP